MELLRSAACLALLTTFGLLPFLSAQDKKDDKKGEMEFPKPGPEQKILAKFAGVYDAKVKMWMPGATEPSESSGVMKRTMIMDGRYMREDYTGDFGGKKFQGMGILGFDPNTKKYFTHWIDSFSTHVMVTHGTYDPETKTFVYRGEEVMGGKKFKTKDVAKLVNENVQSLDMYRSPAETPDKEFKVMEITLTRKVDMKKKDKN